MLNDALASAPEVAKVDAEMDAVRKESAQMLQADLTGKVANLVGAGRKASGVNLAVNRWNGA